MPDCKICRSTIVKDVNNWLRAGAMTQSTIAEQLLQAGVEPPVTQATVSYHKRHMQSLAADADSPEFDEDLVEMIQRVRDELREEMKDQPALLKAQYVIIIAKMSDLLKEDDPKPELALRAIGEINKVRGNAGQLAGIQAFLLGAKTMADTLQGGTSVARLDPPGLPRPVDGEWHPGVPPDGLRDGTVGGADRVGVEGDQAAEPPESGEQLGEDRVPGEGRDQEGVVQAVPEQPKVLVGS